MKQITLLIWMMISLSAVVRANNIRIEGDVRIVAADVDLGTKIATIRFTVKWEKSWRDAFNYDGVYLFFKYKLEGGDGLWHHAYLMDEGHTLPAGYEISMRKSSATVDRCEGLFLYRNDKGYGDTEVDLELKWKITSNTDCLLEHPHFVQGKVLLSAMGMEMVYVPQGAFRVGDTKSKSTFKNKYVTILPDKDILSDTNRAYTYTSSAQIEEKGANPPEFAVNRVNDPGTTTTNAWVGVTKPADQYDWWKVTFDEYKYIYNIAIESIPGRAPDAWEVWGHRTGVGGPTILYTGTAADWITTSHRSYPCLHAIKLEKTKVSYNEIEIRIKTTTMAAVIKNVAMTTESIPDSVDNSVLIWRTQADLVRHGSKLLYADDGDIWPGTFPEDYPNGFWGFWAMKYELSQEQYVAFLNKLTFAQQKIRTIHSDFEKLKEGEFVFGSNRTAPTARNGIILATQGKDEEPHVFANNLNNDEGYSQAGDGQTIACNFLNPSDMMAYADWCGLRPLSEMEYEKMARRTHQYPSIRNEYAWNTDKYVSSTAIQSGAGSKTETVDGYVNAENKIGGPVRCGAYAKTGTNQTNAGASYWGVMELSGNVAEIYYNANSDGRKFLSAQNVHHGDGKLAVSGHSNMLDTYWPRTNMAFALRGGSFASKASELAISDRTYHWGVYTTPDEIHTKRDSTVGFRLGSTIPIAWVQNEIVLQNGMTSWDNDNGLSNDTICSGDDYIILGDVSKIKGAYRSFWGEHTWGHDNGVWVPMPGEEGINLKLTNLININEEVGFFKEYWFFHQMFSIKENGYTFGVRIQVVNDDISINRLRDTINGVISSSVSKGITINTKQNSTFKSTYLLPSGNKVLGGATTTGTSYNKIFRPSDFQDDSGALALPDDIKVLIETTVMNTCTRRDTIQIHIRKPQE